MCETRAVFLAGLSRLVGSLDAESMSGEHAKELVCWFSRVEHLAAAGKTLCAGRVASSGVFSGSGNGAAGWLANETGDSLGNAIRLFQTAGQLKQLPVLDGALRAGELSPAQAAITAAAASEDPSKEHELLRQAGSGSMGDLRRRAEHIRAAVRSERDARARYEQVRAKRSLRWWSDPDGTFRLDGRLTPDAGALLIAEIEPEARRVFKQARNEQRREPFTAYVADALVNLVTGLSAGTPAAGSSGAGSSAAGSSGAGSSGAGSSGAGAPAAGSSLAGSPAGSSPRPPARRMSHSAILRVDLAALRRGELEAGEICEIPGVGPVPLGRARQMLGDVFLKLVITDGVDVQMVCHAGRHVSSFIDTALQERDHSCVVPGCDAARFLERDHWREEFAEGGPTDLPNLCRLCAKHHGLKHTKGYKLRGGPGKWEWIAPNDAATRVDEANEVPPWRVGPA
jgi:hypothetical protein